MDVEVVQVVIEYINDTINILDLEGSLRIKAMVLLFIFQFIPYFCISELCIPRDISTLQISLL